MYNNNNIENLKVVQPKSVSLKRDNQGHLTQIESSFLYSIIIGVSHSIHISGDPFRVNKLLNFNSCMFLILW